MSIRFRSVSPMLQSSDLQRTIDWYESVLGFRCASGDWNAAMSILDNNLSSGLIDKATYRRHRGVLLTARALELEKVDRDLSRESAMEAVKLAPTLVPAAVLASKYESEAHQVRRSMRIVEAAWLAHPHPDLAETYAHLRPGDSARERLTLIRIYEELRPLGYEGGYDAVQMRDVAARANVALGTIYRYFSSKDHLLAEAQVEWLLDLDRKVSEQSEQAIRAADVVMFVVDATVAVWRRGDRRQALVIGGSIVFFALAARSLPISASITSFGRRKSGIP